MFLIENEINQDYIQNINEMYIDFLCESLDTNIILENVNDSGKNENKFLTFIKKIIFAIFRAIDRLWFKLRSSGADTLSKIDQLLKAPMMGVSPYANELHNLPDFDLVKLSIFNNHKLKSTSFSLLINSDIYDYTSYEYRSRLNDIKSEFGSITSEFDKGTSSNQELRSWLGSVRELYRTDSYISENVQSILKMLKDLIEPLNKIKTVDDIKKERLITISKEDVLSNINTALSFVNNVIVFLGEIIDKCDKEVDLIYQAKRKFFSSRRT